MKTNKGALTNATSGNNLLDYFSVCSTYRDREYNAVKEDLDCIWKQNPNTTLRIIFYNRMISRIPSGSIETTDTQKGQGNRSEFRQSLRWLIEKHPDSLYKNLHLVPVVGCWKDLWHNDLLGYIDQSKVIDLIIDTLRGSDLYSKQLLAKYLPKFRSKSNRSTSRHIDLNKFAGKIAARLGIDNKNYRKLKSAGTAHEFQRLMCSNKWDKIDFKKVPGRALFNIAVRVNKNGSTLIEKHGITSKYESWLSTQPVAKFTGFVHELVKQGSSHNKISRLTVNKQYKDLIQKARKSTKGKIENILCALDTSGSMAIGPYSVRPIDVSIGLGIYFSDLNEGYFHNKVFLFDTFCTPLSLSGSFTDKIDHISLKTGWGCTNFSSIIDALVEMRKKNPNIPLSDYPTTILVISDMEFDVPKNQNKTNYEDAIRRLNTVGIQNMKFIWWNVNGRKGNIPSTIEDEGTTLISGYDGAIITLLTGEVKDDTDKVIKLTPLEQMNKVLDQEILRLLNV